MSKSESEPDSEEARELHSLRVVFYGSLFFMVGNLCRFFATTYDRKTAYHAIVYVIGMGMGLMSNHVDHMRDPILGVCGVHCLYLLYLPPYFFMSGFMLEVNEIRCKVLIGTLLVFVPIWVTTVCILTVICHHMLPYKEIEWWYYSLFIVFSMTPDVQTVRMFFKARQGSVDQVLVTLLEFEGLLTASVTLTVFQGLLVGRDVMKSLYALPFEMIMGVVFGLIMGQITSVWMRRIQNDIVVQTAIVTAFIYITQGVSEQLKYTASLSVLCMSLVVMRAKPSLPGRAIEFIKHFVEIIRVGLVYILVVLAGMKMITVVWVIIDTTAVMVSICIYLTLFLIRFVLLLFAWPVYGRFTINGFHDLLMIWACNIRGPFNVLMSFMFLFPAFGWAHQRLFMLASFQIVLSFFVTNPLAGFVLTMVKKRSFEYEKMAMIFRCAKVLKDIKGSFIDVLRKMAFIADADWDTVYRRTLIKRTFLKKYENRNFLLEELPNQSDGFMEKRIRRDSIRLLLRSQRHYLGDQFEQGLVSSHTARMLTHVLVQAYNDKTMTTSINVMKMMSPNKSLLAFHQELANDLKQKWREGHKLLWALLFTNLYSSLMRLMFVAFPYIIFAPYGVFIVWFYNLGFVLVINIYLAVAFYSRKRSTFVLLLIPTLFMCLLELVDDLVLHEMDFHTFTAKWEATTFYQLARFNEFVVKYLQISLAILTLVMKVATVAYLLPAIKKSLVRMVHSLLARAAYSQCEGALSFMHVLKDSLHQLPDSVPDVHLMRSMQMILHQEYLSMRQYIGVLEILNPDIVTALKTFLASKLLMNSQLSVVTMLSNNGYLEDRDVAQLRGIIQAKIRRLKNFPVNMRVVPVKQLIDNVPSLACTKVKASTYVRFGQRVFFKPGDVLVKQGESPQGIFIILKGLLRIECGTLINVHTMNSQNVHAVYYSTLQSALSSYQAVELTNFYSAGYIIGERSYLYDRPGHKTVRCVTKVQALFLPTYVFSDLMGGQPRWDGPISTIEENMWKCVAIRHAVRLIQGSVSVDYLLTARKVQHMMEHSHIIFGEPMSLLHLNVHHFMAVILVHGSVTDRDGDYHYVGPCFIPPRITDMEMAVGQGQRTVFLVIPAVDHGDQEEREETLLRQRPSANDRISDASGDLTSSSDSSDGIPHRRYRDTLFPIEVEERDDKEMRVKFETEV